MSKIQPAVKTLFFEIVTAPDLGKSDFIDLSQCASVVNRRFYRQGLNWVVAGFKAVGMVGYLGNISITKLPDTWVCSNAWHKAYAHWKKQQDDAMEEAGGRSAIAKFRDFKVHMDTDHVTATFATNLRPKDAASNSFAQGEWDASTIIVPNIVADGTGSIVDPEEFRLHMVGVNDFVVAGDDSRGIIDGYSMSRAFPQSPDPVSPALSSADNWLAAMEDVGKDMPEVIANATGQNDDLPYDQDDYPGGDTNAPSLQVVDLTTVTARSLQDTATMKGDTFPCGLIRVHVKTDAESPVSANVLGLIVYLVPGKARGYLTQPMQDM